MKMKSRIMLVAAGLIAGSANATIITTGGSGAAGDAFMTFDQDVTFTLTSAHPGGNMAFVVMNALPAYDGSISFMTHSSGLSFLVNGEGSYAIDTWVDNFDSYIGDSTDHDSYFFGTQVPALNPGDTITLVAGTLSIGSIDPGFSVLASGNYEMFIADNMANRISGVIPEPASLAFIGVFGGGMLFVRRIFMM